jgi:hypothetical protein
MEEKIKAIQLKDRILADRCAICNEKREQMRHKSCAARSRCIMTSMGSIMTCGFLGFCKPEYGVRKNCKTFKKGYKKRAREYKEEGKRLSDEREAFQREARKELALYVSLCMALDLDATAATGFELIPKEPDIELD